MKAKKVWSIFGLIAGIALIFLGFQLALGEVANYYGDTVREGIRFGGDFYTEEYNASSVAANNVYRLGNYLQYTIEFFGYIIVAFGAAVECYFGIKLSEIPKEPKIIIEPAEKSREQE